MTKLWERKSATAAKHKLYEKYLAAWWAKTLQPSARSGYLYRCATYLDAFAGPGEYLNGADGSPVIAMRQLLDHAAYDSMQVGRDRARFAYIDAEQSYVDHLEAKLHRSFGNRLPERLKVIQGAAAEKTIPALDALGSWNNPILAVFDSWGNVNVPLAVLARLAQSRSGEAIVTFGPNWFSRREHEEPQELDSVFGGHEYWNHSNLDDTSEDRWRHWAHLYGRALERAGFKYRLRFEVRPATGQPLYLFFATNKAAGVEAMKEAMWKVDVSDGMQFIDPRCRNSQAIGQIGLWDDNVGLQPELRELLSQRLRETPQTTVESLRQWLLLETARWLPKHAIPALREMREAGLVDYQSRLVRATEVRALSALGSNT